MKTITKLALSNDKRNRTRSILTICTIFLATLLLTTMFVFVFGEMRWQKANAPLEYGSYYGTYSRVTETQLKELSRRSEFSALGLQASAGMLDCKVRAAIIAVDETAAGMGNLSGQFTEGALPQKEDELAAQPEFFKSIGYDAVKVGDIVTLPYRAGMDEKFAPRQFRVSGILMSAPKGVAQNAYTVVVSMSFYEANIPEGERSYLVPFRLNGHVPLTSGSAQDVFEELGKACGIDEKQVKKNAGYLVWALDTDWETLGGCVGIALVVILFSMVVIYNIFQVGIIQKIQEYGKIRALGATKRQLGSLILKEGMFLAAAGIPAGLCAGYGVASAGFWWMMEQTSSMRTGERVQVSLFSVPVLLFCGALAFLTVLLALCKPMRMVASVSPVDAIRYQESSRRGGLRRGKRALTVRSLAFANITANRRRTCATIFTMGLSCVLFVIIANLVGNIDVAYDARRNVTHGQFQIELDYALDDRAYPENNLNTLLKDNPLNETLIEKIKAVDGVTDVRTRPILFAEVNGKKYSVGVFDREEFMAEKQHGGRLGTLEYDEKNNSDAIYFGWSYFMEDEQYEIGQPLTFTLDNGSGTQHASYILQGAFGGADTHWVMTQDAYERLGMSGASVGWLWVDCKKADVPQVKEALEKLLGDTGHVSMKCYADALAQSKLQARLATLMCYLFLGLLGLIGFMNLANTMIMDIITKKQEYGVLSAVGMTNRQLNQSLRLQGMLFTAGTVLVALMVGIPAGYGLFCYGKEHGFYGLHIYHFPAPEIGIMVAAIVLLQLVLSFLLSRNLKKESLVERIRYQG